MESNNISYPFMLKIMNLETILPQKLSSLMFEHLRVHYTGCI